MNSYLKKFVVVVLVIALGFPAFAKEKEPPRQLTREETYVLLELFAKILDETDKVYVEDVDKKKLIEAAINGMLSSLDPHSSFLDEQNFTDMRIQTKGEFGGLGIEITSENGWVKVISPMDDTPAAKAGLQPGDYITHIDGTSVLGLSLTEAVEKMRGKIGTAVTITIRRPGKDAFDVKLKRAAIKIKIVKSELKDDIGYIRVASFNESTTKAVLGAIRDLQKKGGKRLKGFVLDLRNNPGGLLDQAIGLSSLFIEKGEVVSTRGRNNTNIERYNAKGGDQTGGAPLVVLINDGSASASEIVAGALQDHKRAVIVGTKSYGKGSVQTVMPISMNDKGELQYAIRITTARYYTPSGHSIQAKGIVPDIEVLPGTFEPAEGGNWSRSESELHNALANEEDGSGRDPITEKEKQDKAADDERRDYQLDRAIDVLRAIAIYNDEKKMTPVAAQEKEPEKKDGK